MHGGVARIAAELAALLERDDAGALFALAETVHERLEAPALLARTHVGWACWLWRRGEVERAREQLERARAAAAACGCAQLLEPGRRYGLSDGPTTLPGRTSYSSSLNSTLQRARCCGSTPSSLTIGWLSSGWMVTSQSREETRAFTCRVWAGASTTL